MTPTERNELDGKQSAHIEYDIKNDVNELIQDDKIDSEKSKSSDEDD